MGRFEAVLFDAGDTLIRLTGSGTELLREAAATLGSSLDPGRGQPGLATGARPR